MREIRKQRMIDVLPATELVRTMDRASVVLLSRLQSEQVEPLGVAPVANIGELTRLSSRFPSCILLSSAQYATVKLEDE